VPESFAFRIGSRELRKCGHAALLYQRATPWKLHAILAALLILRVAAVPACR